MLYVVYLDEFGHIGPYISTEHPQHNTHPVFGLGGFLVPYIEVRSFSSYFYQRKNELLRWEITRSGQHPAQWEKKGSNLYSIKNILKYPELRRTTFRLLNELTRRGGAVFYVGIEKRRTITEHNPNGLYLSTLREAIKRIDQHCEQTNSHFLIVMDQHEIRHKIVASASMEMFGEAGRKRMIEPPIEVESHLYQTLQYADWICGLIGRLAQYHYDPEVHAQLKKVEEYFGERIKESQIRSGIRSYFEP